MKVETDITNEIIKRVQDQDEQQALSILVSQVSQMDLNVGHNQLIRCMLSLSDFKCREFQSILDSNFKGDPRDIIMEAHARNDTLNYGLDKFV